MSMGSVLKQFSSKKCVPPEGANQSILFSLPPFPSLSLSLSETSNYILLHPDID